MGAAGHSSTFVRTVTQVCGSWRSGLLRDQAALQRLHFTWLRPVAEPAGVPSRRLPALVSQVRLARTSSAGGAPLPGDCADHVPSACLAVQASAAGNVRAALVAARWLHEAGDPDAVQHWQRAPKHPEAQFRLGYASYKGTYDLPQDSDKAFLLLSRALRQLSAQPLVLPPLMSEEGCQDLLCRSACILAMHLDGNRAVHRACYTPPEAGCGERLPRLGTPPGLAPQHWAV